MIKSLMISAAIFAAFGVVIYCLTQYPMHTFAAIVFAYIVIAVHSIRKNS